MLILLYYVYIYCVCSIELVKVTTVSFECMRAHTVYGSNPFFEENF